MKVLSMWNPWASLLVLEEKRMETRCRALKNFGWILIHASQKVDWEAVERSPFKTVLPRHFGSQVYEGLERVRGHIIGAAYFTKCHRTEDVRDTVSSQEHSFGDYGDGRYAWEIAKAVTFFKPVPAKGCLYLWDFDTALLDCADAEVFLTFKPEPVPFMGVAQE